MRRTTLAAGVCICLIGIAAATTAQTPGYDAPAPSTAPSPHTIPAPPSYVGRPRADFPAVAPASPAAGYPMSSYYGTPTAPTGPVASSVDVLLSKWKSASESDRPEAEKDLREALKKEMQANFAQDENAIKGLEAQVKLLQYRLDLRRQKQDEIIDLHLQQLLHDAQGLGWVQPADSILSFSLTGAR